jgi:hypothetical protein
MEAACAAALEEFQSSAQWQPEAAQAADELLQHIEQVTNFNQQGFSTLFQGCRCCSKLEWLGAEVAVVLCCAAVLA